MGVGVAVAVAVKVGVAMVMMAMIRACCVRPRGLACGHTRLRFRSRPPRGNHARHLGNEVRAQEKA